MIVLGKNLCYDPSVNPRRAGVIPYTIENNVLHYLLAIDRKTRELTDFGGGCKAHESPVDAAWREFQEESCGIFSSLSKKELRTSVTLTSKNSDITIFFLYVNSDWLYGIENAFIEKQKELPPVKKYIENIGIKWVNDADFKRIAFDRGDHCMWRRIQNFLIRNTTHAELGIYLLVHGITTVVSKSPKFKVAEKLNTKCPTLKSTA